jgi:hypothetical protein
LLLKAKDGETIELSLSLSQLKKIYVALFRQLHGSGLSAIDDLDEDDMLLTIQTYLQRRAAEAGVDATDHAAWEGFLGIQGAPSCAERFAGRKRPGE